MTVTSINYNDFHSLKRDEQRKQKLKHF